MCHDRGGETSTKSDKLTTPLHSRRLRPGGLLRTVFATLRDEHLRLVVVTHFSLTAQKPKRFRATTAKLSPPLQQRAHTERRDKDLAPSCTLSLCRARARTPTHTHLRADTS